MPTYEYACSSCGSHIEAVQSFTDEPLDVCEKCGGSLRRVFHPVGVLFKGSGFYSTDSRSKKVSSEKKKEAKTDAAAGAKTEAGGTEKSA